MNAPTSWVAGDGHTRSPGRGAREELGNDEGALALDEECDLSFVDATRLEDLDISGNGVELAEVTDTLARHRIDPDRCGVSLDDIARAPFMPRRGEEDYDVAVSSFDRRVEPAPGNG